MFAVMAGFLFLNTANTTLLSAVKNGLFLSAYTPQLIPHAVIAAALLTAFVAVIFTGVLSGMRRRPLAIGLAAVLAISILACRAFFAMDPSASFGIYLWISAVQVLLLTHAWGYTGSMLTGRQAKRILPLIGVGASLGALVGGSAVAPVAIRLGTANLLWISAGLLLVALPLLWLVEEPGRKPEDTSGDSSILAGFARRSVRGFGEILGSDLLRLLALGLMALTMTGTLIDLQLKFLLQDTFGRDDIAAIYGLMSAGVGAGTLLLQLWASRVLFPRFGVSFAAMLHAGLLFLAAGGTAVLGGLAVLVVAQALDDILQFSLQKPVEQVSLLPFPSRVKSVAMTTLGGVLRPLSKAAGGGIALALVEQQRLLPVATVASASLAVAAYSSHRGRYMRALEDALSRHAVDLSEQEHVPLVVDRSTLSILDRALRDDDPTVVVFATSLLNQLAPEDGLPRLVKLLEHPLPEVRAEAAAAFGRLDPPPGFGAGVTLGRRLTDESEPVVVAALLESAGRLGGVDPRTIEPFLGHADHDVRRGALVALGRLGWPETETQIQELLRSESSRNRVVACRSIGELGSTGFVDALSRQMDEAEVRPAALDALAALGKDAVPSLADILVRRELPLSLRRTVVTALASVEAEEAREVLIELLREPALGPAALHSLSRMRAAGSMGPVDLEPLRPVLHEEERRALRLTAVSTLIRRRAEGPSDSFIASELEGLAARSLERILKILALSYDPGRLRAVTDALLSDNPMRRSNALELLEGTLAGYDAGGLVRCIDAMVDGTSLDRLSELLPAVQAMRTDLARFLRDETDWWSKALVLHYLGRHHEVTAPGLPKDESEEAPMIPLIEKVMILKGSEFFRSFPGSELAGIAARTRVVHVEEGEVIFEQGEEGDAFFVVVRGTIRISRASTTLATLGPREGFGEMALLDREPRSATATAESDATLLTLNRDAFDRVIEQNPTVARGVYRVLTERLRNTLAQVAAD